MNYVPSSTDAKQLSELLDKACSLIITLEGYIVDANSDYDDTPCAKEVHKLFNDVDMLNFHPHNDIGPEYDSAGFTEEDRIVEGQYMTYVETVKQNIDQATAEGILKDDCSEGYSYLSKEEWLRRQADQEAQDADLFGENKI
jgi:hypothetical protein